ncbi:N-acetylneuraminate synthase family protein [Ahrensia marina]|uniref:N-acetylneuraminate synthase family protein n=1 Tax=Ahrensia marina TaxID=1514904 RepID=UPI0035CF80A6
MSISTFQIGARTISSAQSAFLIAEVAQSHDGSLGQAHAFINAAADAGADAIKFQTHIASAESTIEEPFRVRLSGNQDDTRYDYWRRMEFTKDQWNSLAQHAASRDIIFLSTPFSLEAVTLLNDLQMPAWKIGSGEVNNWQLLDACAATGKPVLLSSGMSGWAEIDAAVDRLRQAEVPVGVLQCSSRYPTPFEQVGLNVLDDMRQRYGLPVGLSDHSGTVFPALAAMAGNAQIIELHVTFHRKMFGPDVPASVTFEELAFIVEARSAFDIMARNPVAKDDNAEQLADLRALFNKSVALRNPLPAGSRLTLADLTAKKPGHGIPAAQLAELAGLRLAKDVSADRVLLWDDIEGSSE